MAVGELSVIEKGFRLLEEAFTLPIVVWPGYEDGVPEALRERVLPERLAQVMRWSMSGGDDECVDEATDVETLIYLHTATFANPLNRTWYRIFFHLAFKYYGDKLRSCPDLAPLEDEVRELDRFELEQLRRLKRWIRSVQRRHLREKLKGMKKREAMISGEGGDSGKGIEVVGEQAKLTDFL